MRALLAGAAAGAVLTMAPALGAAEDVSSGGRIECDLHQNADNPAEALIDGDIGTHFAHHRLEDAEWRQWLRTPAVLSSVTFVQGWPDWSQATTVELTLADGTRLSFDLQTGTREVQTFPIDAPAPTAFVDVHVLAAQPSSSGEGWGGFAELGLEGTPDASGDTTAPVISAVQLDQPSATEVTVSWHTDEPATSQVRYSTTALFSALTAPDPVLLTDHAVTIQAAAPLAGQLELRSADAAGNRAELRHDAFVTIDTSYQYGVGGWSFHLGSDWVPAQELFATDELAVGFAQQWVGGDGWTDWFTADGVRQLHDAGYTPEVIHYYFGDPEMNDVIARSSAFIADIQTLADLLTQSGVGSDVLVTLEPEFNQGAVATWDGWNDLMLQAIQILHDGPGCKVGLLPGDWDIDHVLPISMGRAAAQADFIAYQEMRASTRSDPTQGREVITRAIRFSHYLSRKFLRPVRLGYLMVSDYGGWEALQRDVVIELCERQPELATAGTVAASWMSYLDHPGAGGYFDEAEAHKGLKLAGNTPKPAWHVFKECAAHGASWLDTGQEPPGAIPPHSYAEDGGCGCRLASPHRWTPAGWAASLLLLFARRRRRRRVRRAAVLA